MTGTTSLTDPARELAEVCQRLYAPHESRAGSTFLAEQFGVVPYSKDFYQIIFSIIDRIEFLKNVIADLELDPDHKSEALIHADALTTAFNNGGLQNSWHNNGSTSLSPLNVQPIKMLSPMVRSKISYPRLSDEDAEKLELEVAELAGWLKKHQLSKQDFIRQSIIEGLEQFLFRLDKMQWLGYGYTIASLREVIAAYMALDRNSLDPNEQPIESAILHRTATVIKSAYSYIARAKDYKENYDFILTAFNATSVAITSYPVIKGLLSSG